MKQLFINAYQRRTNDQVGRVKETIASRLKRYIADHLKDWDAYDGQITYAYNNHLHRSTVTTPFNLIMSHAPPSVVVVPRRTQGMTPKRQGLPSQMGHPKALHASTIPGKGTTNPLPEKIHGLF